MSIFLLCAVIATTCAINAPKLSDKDISNSIEMIVKELVVRFDTTQCWESNVITQGWLSRYHGGTTAIATLALLSAGQSINAQTLDHSLEYLWKIEDPSSYVLSLRISIWAMLPDRFPKRLKTDTKQLIATMGESCGGWGNRSIPPRNAKNASPLIREFGMIALREAGRCGVSIPKQCWLSIANATLTTQHQNGGWSYDQGSNQSKATANMTVAGLNCLLGVDEVFSDDLSTQDATQLHSAINNGISWLNKHARTDKNSGGTALMSYLYALERAAMSCGLAEIRKKDWYLGGARAALDAHCGVRKAKGSTVNLSFALLFLARGRVPLAICELSVDKGRVDPFRLSDTIAKRISTFTEQSLGWKLVTNEDSVESWLSAPLLIIQDINAIPKDQSQLTTYIEQGGLLVMIATGKSMQPCSDLANNLCPNIEMQVVPTSHWSLSLLKNGKGVQVKSWHDGIRDRILLVRGSPKKLVSRDKSTLWNVLLNICCGAAELDGWLPRLRVPTSPKTKGSIVLAEHSGNWDFETVGLYRWRVKCMPLVNASGKPLILVGGIDKEEATPQLAAETIQVASSGSIVVVESIGGRGGFAKAMMQEVAKKISVVMQPEHSLGVLTGRRAWTIRNQRQIDPPLVAVIGKGKILFVDCDIRNALLGHSSWGIHGYSTASAVQLIDSMLGQ